MRVLWFSSSSSMYKGKFTNHHYNGVGWISSLEQLLATKNDIELAVSFFHPTDNEKCIQNRVTYYPILNKKESYIRRFYNNILSNLESEVVTDKLLKVIIDFKPDIIQVFGFEGPFAIIQEMTTIPVILHIQGIINPYNNAWYPPGINSLDDFFMGSKFFNILKANNKWFNKQQFIKQANREYTYFPITHYLMGRTLWDRELSKLLMPNAKYFHVNEVLRPVFYDGGKWSPKQRDIIKISTTISPSTYKGFDIILKTAHLLKEHTKMVFEWHVYGSIYDDPTVKLMERKFNLKYKNNNIIFFGALAPNELLENLLDSDIYVHPSYIENSPNSVAEAQILGLPVIACNVGGLSSMIENNITGILVAANDPYHMAYKIKMIAEDKLMAAQLGMRARTEAIKRHNKENILYDVVTNYNTILNNDF